MRSRIIVRIMNAERSFIVFIVMDMMVARRDRSDNRNNTGSSILNMA